MKVLFKRQKNLSRFVFFQAPSKPEWGGERSLGPGYFQTISFLKEIFSLVGLNSKPPAADPLDSTFAHQPSTETSALCVELESGPIEVFWKISPSLIEAQIFWENRERSGIHKVIFTQKKDDNVDVFVHLLVEASECSIPVYPHNGDEPFNCLAVNLKAIFGENPALSSRYLGDRVLGAVKMMVAELKERQAVHTLSKIIKRKVRNAAE